jgi:hypothetical protein
MRRFVTSPDPLAVVAYFLLDESVATALGNGVVNHFVNPPDYAKRLKRDMGFYNDHSIDATAKGLLARTQEDPTTGPPLDSAEVVTALIAATRDAVGADPPPIQYLHSFSGASEPGWWQVAMKPVTEKAHSNNVYESTPFDASGAVAMITQHPSISAVLLVPRARLSSLAAYGDSVPHAVRSAIAREARTPAGFAYVFRRSHQAWMFVIVADAPEQAKSVASTLFSMASTKPGVYRPSP